MARNLQLDSRYVDVKNSLERGDITKFEDIFIDIPPTVVAIDFETNYTRFDKLISDASSFKLKELYLVALLFNVDRWLIVNLAYKQSKKVKVQGKVEDQRYETVKMYLDNGRIINFRDIFTYIKRTVVAEDLGINYTRFIKLINNTEEFKLQELYLLAHFFKVDRIDLIQLAFNASKNVVVIRKKTSKSAKRTVTKKVKKGS